MSRSYKNFNRIARKLYYDNISIAWGIECTFVNVDKKNKRWERGKKVNLCIRNYYFGKILILFTLKHHPDFKCLAWLGDHLNIVTWFELTIL